jgi:hypothetical protein
MCVLITGVFVLTLLLAAAPSAKAGSGTYCAKSYPSGADCYGPRHSLRRNYANNYYGDSSYLEAAAALDTTLHPYGTWKYEYGSACHSYSGQNLLYPWLYNPDSRGQTIVGVAYYGAETPCP